MTPRIDPPLALLAELTHRCPLRCPYCSNPVALERASDELTESEWRRVLGEAAALGILQVHFSGGEPMARRDLPALIAAANDHGLYGNLITSGALGGERELSGFAGAGLKHVQLSFQDVDPATSDRIAGLAGAHARKTRFAAAVRAAGLPLTLNMVVHRQNLDRVSEMIDMALTLGARRLEIAHVQYYAWALANRAALLPSRCQLDEATRTVEAAREKLKGVLAIDYVVPDYHGVRPKSCMSGWARRFLNLTPSGKALPCHAAETLPDLAFPSVRDSSLSEHLVPLGGVQSIPRHRLDGRTLSELQAARDRLGRLPLPGFPFGRRCEPRRPGLRAVARPRHRRGRHRTGGERAGYACLSPLQLSITAPLQPKQGIGERC